MGKNFIGPAEYSRIANKFPVQIPTTLPRIPLSAAQLKKFSRTHLLILGASKFANKKPLTLVNLRDFFGVDPTKSEPCMYNQDWYVKEKFANATPRVAWYLLQKNLLTSSRGKIVRESTSKLPSAVVVALAFFVQLLAHREYLWKHDFVWCSDTDASGDRIYVGRYADKTRKSKNGFNVHRHLSIKNNLGSITSSLYAS